MRTLPEEPRRETARATIVRRGVEGGFTLLELMVAMALAAVLIGMVVMVSTNAQKLYEETSSKVEVLQKARYVLNDITDHLKSAVVTSDLEYFIDQGSGTLGRNGHWDEGEELQDSAAGPNLVGGRPGYYDEGAHIIERHYATEHLGIPSRHANYSIYFKAPTTVRGEQRVGNIEYYLADPVAFDRGETGKLGRDVEDNTGLVLVKVVRYIDTNESNFFNQEIKTKEERIELCSNVTDLKIEYLYDNVSDGRPGRFVSPSEESDVATSEQRPERLADGGVVKEFLYGGFRVLGTRGTFHRGRRQARRGELVAPYFRVGNQRMYFSELKYDDTIYIWSDGGAAQFPSGDYSVFRREFDKLYFKQSVDTTNWKGDEGRLRFKAGYLPSAFRVTVRVLNNSGRAPRNISVVVHPQRKNP